ncbi:hypothetical protein VNO77_44788 [Canavalia gladiata]|uniref:Uncharacterized protein n=1 Tax=Canavalia gladiata TaxID=3824 RepID=A0AAN9PRC7_CANGL
MDAILGIGAIGERREVDQDSLPLRALFGFFGFFGQKKDLLESDLPGSSQHHPVLDAHPDSRGRGQHELKSPETLGRRKPVLGHVRFLFSCRQERVGCLKPLKACPMQTHVAPSS